ncbi:MAG: HAMP domain-containing protein, partial [Comamonadaceae bacterium]
MHERPRRPRRPAMNTLPVPLEPVIEAIPRVVPASAGRPAWRPATTLTQRLVLAFGALLVLLAALTGVAALSARGAAAAAVLGLGLAAIAVALALAAWLLRDLAAPALRASAAAARMSAGDLTQEVNAGRRGELGPLLQALEEVRERLFAVVGEVRSGTTHVAMNSSQVTRDNEALSQRTNTQAESLQQTAATMEQLTAAVRQNAETAQQANALVRSATERAEQG